MKVEVLQTAEYKAFHKQVVDACVELCGEDTRDFWDSCDYIDDFKSGDDPQRVAETNVSYCD